MKQLNAGPLFWKWCSDWMGQWLRSQEKMITQSCSIVHRLRTGSQLLQPKSEHEPQPNTDTAFMNAACVFHVDAQFGVLEICPHISPTHTCNVIYWIGGWWMRSDWSGSGDFGLDLDKPEINPKTLGCKLIELGPLVMETTRDSDWWESTSANFSEILMYSNAKPSFVRSQKLQGWIFEWCMLLMSLYLGKGWLLYIKKWLMFHHLCSEGWNVLGVIDWEGYSMYYTVSQAGSYWHLR